MNDVAEALNFAGLKSAGLIQETYDNFIGGKWVKPLDGKYLIIQLLSRRYIVQNSAIAGC